MYFSQQIYYSVKLIKLNSKNKNFSLLIKILVYIEKVIRFILLIIPINIETSFDASIHMCRTLFMLYSKLPGNDVNDQFFKMTSNYLD